jgi:molecular chaperone Hsp33
MDRQNVEDSHVCAAFAEGMPPPSVAKGRVSDRIVVATAAAGSVFIAAGITTSLVREVWERHQLAPTVGMAAGRLITGAALLGSRLKSGERLSLQIAGEGQLRTLVADVCRPQPGEIGARAYASVTDVEPPHHINGKSRIALAIGKGWLQATRSYPVGQPYVGITPLASGEIGDDIAQYLLQSEQVPSVISLGVLVSEDGLTIAGGAIAQLLPGAPDATIGALNARVHEMPSITALIEQGASPEALAQSLAGVFELQIQESYDVSFFCRCTIDKVSLALMSLGRDELVKLISEQEETEAVCEFCKKQYLLSREELQSLIKRLDERRNDAD